jgi:transcriptional regulator with XRE-family HTH domain
VDYFWGGEKLPADPQKDFVKYMALRHVIIGTTLRQYRDKREMKLSELADEVSISQGELSEYETGRPVSFLDLAKIVRALDRTIMDMTDDDYGPLAQHENEIAQKKKFDDMPEDMKAFVIEPINRRYIEAAIQLSHLDVDRLRSIGESLLEITY